MSPPLRHVMQAGVTLEVIGDDRLKVDGALTDDLRSQIREHKRSLMTELSTAPRYRWRIIDPVRGPIGSCFLPQIPHAEIMRRHPGARAWPLAESEALSEVAA